MHNLILGLLLPYALFHPGNPAVSFIYTYGDDADGSNYLITYSTALPSAEKKKTLRWNVYVKSEGKYLLEWSDDRRTGLDTLQVALNKRVPDHVAVIARMLKAQRLAADGSNDLFFVLADDKNEPKYHVPISEMCAKFPKAFRDLTNDRKCDAI